MIEDEIMSIHIWNFRQTRIGPKFLQIVMFPELRHKGVQHQFSVIDHYPLAVVVSVLVVRLAASRLKHLLPHAVGDCRYLRGGTAFTYDKLSCGGHFNAGKVYD